MNSKKILAVVGLIILLINLAKSKDAIIDKSMFKLSVTATLVSLASLFAVTFNSTHETSYVTYIISMWVWTSGAYAVMNLIKVVHGHVSIRIICNYLIAVCVLQCVLALLIDSFPLVKELVNNHIGKFGGSGTALRMDERNRLYGIGAALDIAGTRFSAILIMIVYICIKYYNELTNTQIIIYFLAFLFITLVGNMISRTTTVGFAISILYCCFCLVRGLRSISKAEIITFRNLTGILAIFILFVIGAYNKSAQAADNIRFAFEGFFNLVEKGVWNVHSNNILANMYVFPDNQKTWLIGDGYFENPTSDPTYMGYLWEGFYMGTDVGYLRFLFYFGLVGLICFSIFMFQVCNTCILKHPQHKALFILLLLLNFCIWFKVSTDIFLVFAPFLCLNTKRENEMGDEPLEIELEQNP